MRPNIRIIPERDVILAKSLLLTRTWLNDCIMAHSNFMKKDRVRAHFAEVAWEMLEVKSLLWRARVFEREPTELRDDLRSLEAV